MNDTQATERIHTVVIGGGQAGLSTGYWLKRHGIPFVILEAGARVGDVWRSRWDSLRLFTPAQFDGLDGMPFPAPAGYFPTKDEMADYLEAYATRFDLPVRLQARVTRVSRARHRFVVESDAGRIEANNVVVAMASYQQPYVPDFAAQLAPDIVQLHSAHYRRPDQLPRGPVLLVGAGNSGSEIAMELSRDRTVWMAGRDVGQIPFRIYSFLGRHVFVRLVLRGVFHRVLTVATPIGRRVRPKVLSGGGPLIRVKRSDLDRRGVHRVPRVVGVSHGMPQLADGRVLDVAGVVWCTGYRPGLSWLDMPVHGDHEPLHERGVVPRVPGLYFVGLHFLYAMSSTMIHGVGRDAHRIARTIAGRGDYGATLEPSVDASRRAERSEKTPALIEAARSSTTMAASQRR